MNNRAGDLRKTLIILILAAVAVLIYLVSIYQAYPVFQSTRLTDPLAEINSLFPLYYIAIALSALSIVVCLLWRIENKLIHIPLLMIFAVMLWLTPYCLTGLVRLGDSLWHVGISMDIPQVLQGEQLAFSEYGWGYPGSFIYHYSSVQILGIQPLTYIGNFPLLCLLLFVLLCYLLAAKVFNSRVALLSMLLAIPGLHYLQLHASPHTIGALLMLTGLLLLIQRGAVAKVIPIVIILISLSVVSHPTTPLLIAIFLAAALLTSVIYSRRIGRHQLMLAGLLIICFAGWFCWYYFHHALPWMTTETLYNKANPGSFEVGQRFLTGTPFIYRNIHSLNKGIYFLYAAAGVLGLIYTVAKDYTEKRSIKNWLSKLGGISRSEACLAISILPLVLLSFLLAEEAHVLIETGLTYIILALSCIIASVVIRWQLINRKAAPYFIALGVLFLTLTSPIVAYSIDAYSSIPKSEGAGLKFLSEEVPLNGKSVSIWLGNQLAFYPQPSFAQADFELLRNLKVEPDVAVFRNTGYYNAAMRSDFSFEYNSYTKYLAAVKSSRYDRIYSSPTFEVYSRDKGKQ